MDTTTPAIRPNRRRLGGKHSPTCFQMPDAHRRAIQAIADYKVWPESEVYRQAVAAYLRENKHLLQMLIPSGDSNGHTPTDPQH